MAQLHLRDALRLHQGCGGQGYGCALVAALESQPMTACRLTGQQRGEGLTGTLSTLYWVIQGDTGRHGQQLAAKTLWQQHHGFFGHFWV